MKKNGRVNSSENVPVHHNGLRSCICLGEMSQLLCGGKFSICHKKRAHSTAVFIIKIL